MIDFTTMLIIIVICLSAILTYVLIKYFSKKIPALVLYHQKESGRFYKAKERPNSVEFGEFNVEKKSKPKIVILRGIPYRLFQVVEVYPYTVDPETLLQDIEALKEGEEIKRYDISETMLGELKTQGLITAMIRGLIRNFWDRIGDILIGFGLCGFLFILLKMWGKI